MGSFVAQDYIRRHGGSLAAAVLTGPPGWLGPEAGGLSGRVAEAVARDGRDGPSMDFAMLFADFNTPFSATPPPGGLTGFEWLSRDEAEVKLYVDDPWCGFLFSNGFVADMASGIEDLFTAGAADTVPKRLPILIMAGALDPVGQAGEGVRALTDRYRSAGLTVTERLYPDARHEIFNETNRDEVHRDLIEWLRAVVPRA
jgi:alpha-beta hydrolase superfamily lysophospholipase